MVRVLKRTMVLDITYVLEQLSKWDIEAAKGAQVRYRVERFRPPSFSAWKRNERLIGGLRPYVNLMAP